MSSPSSQTIGSCVLVAVVVPGPGRGDDEIAGLHRRALAVDRGIGAVPLDDEAQRRLRVAVRRRDLARQDQLQPGEQRAGDRGLALETRVFSISTRRVASCAVISPPDLHQVRPHLAVMPDRRHARGRGSAVTRWCSFSHSGARLAARCGRRTPAARGCGPGACFRRHGRDPPLPPISLRVRPPSPAAALAEGEADLARSASNAADCASVSGTIGGRTAAQSGSLWKCATMRFRAGTIG